MRTSRSDDKEGHLGFCEFVLRLSIFSLITTVGFSVHLITLTILETRSYSESWQMQGPASTQGFRCGN